MSDASAKFQATLAPQKYNSFASIEIIIIMMSIAITIRSLHPLGV